MVSWLKELAAKLKNALTAYKDVKPDSPEGKMVAEMEEFRNEIMGIYTSALVDAGENFRGNGGNINTTREGGAKYQARQNGFMDQMEIMDVRDIVEKVVLLDSYGMDQARVKSHNSLLMHSLYAIADVGSVPEEIKLYVEEMNNPNASGQARGRINYRMLRNTGPQEGVHIIMLAP